MPKKRPDGRYQRPIRFEDEQGRKQRKFIYAQTLRELDSLEADFRAQLAAGQRVAEGDCTVTEWAKTWRETYKDPHVGAKSLEMYKRNLDLITKAIGFKPLKSVRQGDLQRILNSRASLSGSAVRKTAMVIRALFKAAAVNRMIPFSPAEGLQLPRQTDGSHRALTKQETDRILQFNQALDIEPRQPHRFCAAVMLMLYAGLRRGEVAAFDISRDVDFQNGMLTVSRAVSYANNTPVIKATKTAAGRRSLPIFPPLLPFLEGKAGFAARPSGSSQARNIKEKAVQPITLQAFRLAFRDFMDQAGVDCTPHDLRHTFFTILYDAGVDVKTAQRWGGHASVAVTMEIYTHLSQERETASKALIDAYFNPPGSQSGSQTEKSPA